MLLLKIMLEQLLPFIPYIVVGTVAPVTAKIVLNSGWYTSKSKSKMEKLDQEYIAELENRMRFYKNKANKMEQGPKVEEGELDDLSKLLPGLLGQFGDFAPKWLKPFLNNSNIQEALIKKVQENPEQFASMFGKMVSKAKGKKNEQQLISDAEISV